MENVQDAQSVTGTDRKKEKFTKSFPHKDMPESVQISIIHEVIHIIHIEKCRYSEDFEESKGTSVLARSDKSRSGTMTLKRIDKTDKRKNLLIIC